MRELWLARNTIIDMINYRGYQSTQKSLTSKEFASMFPSASSNASSLNFVSSYNGTQIIIYFNIDEKISKANLEKIIIDQVNQGIDHIILISTTKLNPACNMMVKSSKVFIEHFLLQNLQFNILTHELVPKHRVMSLGESDNLLKKLRAEKGSLPSILTNDPVCRFIGAKVGDIIEIERNSKTTEKSMFYRAVVSPLEDK